MKKLSIACAIIFSAFLVNAQTKTITLSDFKIAPFDCEYSKRILLSMHDTSYSVSLAFINKNYPSLNQEAYLILVNENMFKKFVADFDSAIVYKGEGSMSWNERWYSFFKDSEGDRILVHNRDENEYTSISIENAELLSAWLHRIEFASDIIKP